MLEIKKQVKLVKSDCFLFKVTNIRFNRLLLGIYDMKQCKVIKKLEIDNLEVIFNSYAKDEYRVLSIIFDNDDSYF